MPSYRQLPAGLPPDLRNRIARPGAGSLYGYQPGVSGLGGVQGLDGWFSKVVGVVKKAVSVATAPMRVAITAPVKLVTGAARGIGIPVKGIDSALNKMVKNDISEAKTSLMIGAGVGVGILTGGTALPALIPTVIGAGGQLLNASMPTKRVAQAPTATAVEQTTGAPPVGYGQAVAAQLQQQGIDVNAVTGQPVGPDGRPLPQVMQAGMFPTGMSPLVVVGGLAALGVVALLLTRKREP